MYIRASQPPARTASSHPRVDTRTPLLPTRRPTPEGVGGVAFPGMAMGDLVFASF